MSINGTAIATELTLSKNQAAASVILSADFTRSAVLTPVPAAAQ